LANLSNLLDDLTATAVYSESFITISCNCFPERRRKHSESATSAKAKNLTGEETYKTPVVVTAATEGIVFHGETYRLLV